MVVSVLVSVTVTIVPDLLITLVCVTVDAEAVLVTVCVTSEPLITLVMVEAGKVVVAVAVVVTWPVEKLVTVTD